MNWLKWVNVDFARSIITNKDLFYHLVRRDIVNRYKGSYVGVFWALFNPLLLLAVYTFVFSVIMRSKWGIPGEGRLDFAIVLFAGLICFNIYGDAANRSANIVVDNKNYVKKVVFPLQFLPMISLASSLFTGVMSFCVLIVAIVVFKNGFGFQVLYFPLVLIPLMLMTLGAVLLISALGVYVRDVAQIVGLFNMVFMFLSPVFFPIERIPQAVRFAARLNPIADVVTQTRSILIFGGTFDWHSWMWSFLVSIVIFQAGLAFFYAVKKGFADVL